MRASDEDRERVVAALKGHCAAGRLTLDELPGRVEHAYAAATLAELEELRTIAPRLARYGFSLVATDRRTLVFVRSGIVRTHRVQLTLHELDGNRTRLTIHGTAPLGIRRAFAQLRS